MLEILLYPLSGFFMKLSDDMHDKKNNQFLGIIAGIFCGLSLGYLVTISTDAAYIFFAVFIGTLLAKKINCINHLLTAIIFLGVAFLLGFPPIGIATLIILTLAAYIDEMGNDNTGIYKKSKFMQIFFEYRFALKTTIIVLALFGVINSLYPNFQIYGVHFLQLQTVLLFLFFEMSYEFAGFKFDAIYHGIYRLANNLSW